MPSRFISAIKSIWNPTEYYGEDLVMQKILSEYKNKRHNYEEFRLAAHKTIEAILEEHNFKYNIMSRTKTPERLKEKLLRKRALGVHYNSLHEIEDLTGVRIIFYTESDKERFLKKIRREIDGFLKIEELSKDNGYRATHIVMSFGPKRLQLSEYKHFRGLKSEIQLTSILHHTWAEIEHDLIYKDINGLRERNPKKFEDMKKKMKEIMEQYIKKASEEMEKILDPLA